MIPPLAGDPFDCHVQSLDMKLLLGFTGIALASTSLSATPFQDENFAKVERDGLGGKRPTSEGKRPTPGSAEDLALRAAIDMISDVECPPDPGEQSDSEKLEDMLDDGKICIETDSDSIEEVEGTTSKKKDDGSTTWTTPPDQVGRSVRYTNADAFKISPRLLPDPSPDGPDGVSSGGKVWDPGLTAVLAGVLAHECTHTEQPTGGLTEAEAELEAYTKEIEMLCKLLNHPDVTMGVADKLCQRIKGKNKHMCTGWRLPPASCPDCPDASPPCTFPAAPNGPVATTTELLLTTLKQFRGDVTLDPTDNKLFVDYVDFSPNSAGANLLIDFTVELGGTMSALSFTQLSPDFIVVSGYNAAGQGVLARVDLDLKTGTVDAVTKIYEGPRFGYPASIERIPRTTDLFIYDTVANEVILYTARSNSFVTYADVATYPRISTKNYLTVYSHGANSVGYTVTLTDEYYVNTHRAYEEHNVVDLIDNDGDGAVDEYY